MVCAAVSEFTSVSPEVEKPGLLILVVWTGPRFPPGFPPPSAAGRRLADVWVPRDVSGFAEAWDFSVSSLLRTSHLSTASPTVAGVFHEVETRKCAFQGTAASVAERGASFVPPVLEACGRGVGGQSSVYVRFVCGAAYHC